MRTYRNYQKNKSTHQYADQCNDALGEAIRTKDLDKIQRVTRDIESCPAVLKIFTKPRKDSNGNLCNGTKHSRKLTGVVKVKRSAPHRYAQAKDMLRKSGK